MTPDSAAVEFPARAALRDAAATGNRWRAIQSARACLDHEPTLRTYRFIRKQVEACKNKLSLKTYRVALLSSFSIEFIADSLIVQGFLEGFDVEIYQSGFAQFRQEILNPESGLYAFHADLTLLACEGKDWIPWLYQDYLATRLDAATLLAQWQDELVNLLSLFRQRSDAALLVHNFAPPSLPSTGILDAQSPTGQQHLVEQANALLREACLSHKSVFVLPYDLLVARFGAANWYDRRMEHLARAPISQALLPELAREYASFMRALSGRSRKCLVMDLDNTLWGGVLGEDGVDGIALGPHYPGSAFVEFQHAILDLHHRGVLLAIASKNNVADVEEVFAEHPHMVLKMEHFAARQIHWRPKSESLQEIARTLNIGLDHVVFVDDNPIESDQVTTALPMVTPLLLPAQPERYAQLLRGSRYFDTLSSSSEDERRGELYRQRESAEQLRSGSGSLEDFYRSLQMVAFIAPVDQASLPRASQLTQKTNQFNATTRRYSEAEIQKKMADPNWEVTTIRLQDRFGDNGIVGVMMMGFGRHAEAEIDVFLLSCRVIGRTVETAMLSYLCGRAREMGCHRLVGKILPTSKNAPVRDLFQRHGFLQASAGELGDNDWSLDLRTSEVEPPEWIQIS